MLFDNLITIHFEGVGGYSWSDVGFPSAGKEVYTWAKLPPNA